jgi:molecular chaperone HtpG
MGGHMRRLLEAAGQQVPEPESTLEINPTHPLIQRLDTEQDDSRFAELAALIYAQAQLAEGSQLKEPAQYVARLNKLLLDLLQ